MHLNGVTNVEETTKSPNWQIWSKCLQLWQNQTSSASFCHSRFISRKPLTAIALLEAQGYNQLMAPTYYVNFVNFVHTVLLPTNWLLVSKCLQLKITDSVSATVFHHHASLRKTSCSQQTQLTQTNSTKQDWGSVRERPPAVNTVNFRQNSGAGISPVRIRKWQRRFQSCGSRQFKESSRKCCYHFHWRSYWEVFLWKTFEVVVVVGSDPLKEVGSGCNFSLLLFFRYL